MPYSSVDSLVEPVETAGVGSHGPAVVVPSCSDTSSDNVRSTVTW
jgi:hypothetical protein